MKQWALDILGVTGVASVVYGAALLHPAAGFITFGVLALAVAVQGAKRWAS